MRSDVFLSKLGTFHPEQTEKFCRSFKVANFYQEVMFSHACVCSTGGRYFGGSSYPGGRYTVVGGVAISRVGILEG